MSDNIYEGNGWNTYQKLVLHELQQLNKKADKNLEEHASMKEQIASLKIKSGVWGGIAGIIPVAITLVIWYISTTH